MSITALYLVCPPGETAPRHAELGELLTVTEVTGPFPPPAPDALARMHPVRIPDSQHIARPGEQGTGPGQARLLPAGGAAMTAKAEDARPFRRLGTSYPEDAPMRLPRGPGLFRVGTGDGRPFVTNIRRIAGRDTPPGERLIAAATILLAVLAAGFLYVTLNAQYHYIFVVKNQSVASMIEASGLDAGMIVFSLLALGLARAGQSARTERTLILACALASAGMQYEAADTTSPRSLAVYVMPPVFLAVVVDRVIAVVRRWVTGGTERSAWLVLGRAVLAAGRLAVLVLLYLLRLVLAPVATAKGLRRGVLQTAPLPGSTPRATPGLEAEVEGIRISLARLDDWHGELDHQRERVNDLFREVKNVAAEVFGAGQVFATKKEAFLHAYRQHPDYGDRSVAAKVAAELAPAAQLQPGTARSYVYEELGRANGDSK